MQNENLNKSEEPIEIETVKIPESIKVNHNSPNKCYYNSYMVAKENEEVEIIEGIGLIVGNDNTAKAFEHAWNKKDGVYFDVTIEDPTKISSDIEKIKYVKLFSYKIEEFKNVNRLEFKDETKKLVNDINKKLKLK